VIVFDSEKEDIKNNIIFSGELFKVNSLQLIIKRVILTGYPHKINKKKQV